MLNDFGRIEGLLVGEHGEGLSDMLHLISRIVKRMVMMKFRTMGFSSARGTKITVMSQLYVTLQYVICICNINTNSVSVSIVM